MQLGGALRLSPSNPGPSDNRGPSTNSRAIQLSGRQLIDDTIRRLQHARKIYEAYKNYDFESNKYVSSKKPASVYEEHVEILIKNGINFDRNKLVATAQMPYGDIAFLEQGDSRKGLTHILGHKAQFEAQDIPESQIPTVVMGAVTNGKFVGTQGKNRPVYEITFDGCVKHIAVTRGDNEYIVSANPATSYKSKCTTST